jgi:hypothetical protein
MTQVWQFLASGQAIKQFFHAYGHCRLGLAPVRQIFARMRC